MLKKHMGIRLDLGCGANKQSGFVGMDRRALPGVDIVHDLEVLPYPLKDAVVTDMVGVHIIEHLKPWLMIDIFNEWWRILKVGGRFALVAPYGVSFPFVQDPTHCNPVNEATFQYFDPRFPLYDVYEPKPWKIEQGFPAWKSDGLIEVLLTKISEEDGKTKLQERKTKGGGGTNG